MKDNGLDSLIYVRLVDEGTEVSRPTHAINLGEGLFKLSENVDCNRGEETWEFPPGSIVRAVVRVNDVGEEFLLAVELK